MASPQITTTNPDALATMATSDATDWMHDMTVPAQVATAIGATGLDINAVDVALRQFLAERRARGGAQHEAFAELWEAIEHSALGGKKLRSHIFLTAYRQLAGDAAAHRDQRAAIDIACALELLHTAFVVHDDVIDDDLVRRGDPNVSGRAVERGLRAGADLATAARFGLASGIIAGDVLLSASLALIGGLEVDAPTRRTLLRLIDETVVDTAAGEHADVWFGLGLEPATRARVLQTVELKTARYSCQAPLEAAAILAGSDAQQLAALSEIGRGLGVVYQLRDDVLGVFGSSVATGKSALSDLREGIQTLLIVYARATPEWERVGHLFGDPDLDESGADALRRAIRASGALDRVELTIAAECAIVREGIDGSGLPSELRAFLRELLDRCVERES